MSARDSILSAVRSAKPAPLPLPDVKATCATFPRNDEDQIAKMMRVAAAGGSNVAHTTRAEISSAIARAYPQATRTISMLAEFPGNSSFGSDAHALEDLDLFVCEGVLGVAEDGSVWLPADRLQQRAALFLATHVVIVLNESMIVRNLHEAYERIDIASSEFGVFVSGPSKTADIEQSLVIGAHGPKSLTLILVH